MASTADMSPSDLLAAVAGALLDSTDWEGMVDRIEAPNDWLLPGSILCREIGEIVGPAPFRPPADAVALADWLLALQRLDRWHAPLLPHNQSLPKLDGHYEALDRFYGREGRYNIRAELGLVIPGRAPASAYLDEGEDDSEEGPGDEARASRGLLLDILDNVAFLPPRIDAADPDDEDGPMRSISLGYQRALARSRSIPALNSSVRIAIAPLAEGEDDLQFTVDGSCYGIRPAYPPDRIAEAVTRAVEEEAHILCLPEMSVDEAELPRLSSALIDARGRFSERTGRAPALRYVAAGIVAAASGYGEPHRNYILVMDADGNPIAEQDKLSHWNLTPGQQARFGIADRFPVRSTAAGAILREGTRPGTAINIVDLDGLGRIVTLICADMNQNRPGDWLLTHFRVDWLYAPIMDGSTCWTQPDTPWIIKRAVRAARVGRSRVVVTNSVTMTCWNNAVITKHAEDPGYPYVPYAECGIGLLVDPAKPTTLQQHVVVPLGRPSSPVVEIRSWDTDWQPFPRPSRPPQP